MTTQTQLQHCREVAAALTEETSEWRRKDAEWREHRQAAEAALRDMPFLRGSYAAALARAEAAEAERDALRDERDRYHGLACRLLRQRGDLRRQVAELEAALAAQQWRPGNEKPDATGWYQTIEAEDCYSHAAWDGAVWQGYPGNNPPLFWRPIPPTASETTQ